MLIDKKLILEAKQKMGKQAAILIAEDLQLKSFDKDNLKACCPFHQEDTPSFIWSDRPDGLYYHCFGQCNRKYDILDHFIFFYHLTYINAVKKLFELTGIEYTFGEQGAKTKTEREYHYPYPEGDLGNEVIEYAKIRKISEETLRQFDIGQDQHGNIVFNYYDTNDVLCMVKYRPAKKVEKSELKYWLQKEKGDSRDVFMPILFGMNKIDITKTLLLTEGEIDSLSVAESGFRNVASLPNGASKYEWIEFNWEWLESFEKIIIWFDNDKPGVTTRRDTCTRLGAYRTKFVNLPQKLEKDGKEINVKDASDVLYHFGSEKVLDLINNAQEMPIQNIVDLSEVEDFDIETAPGLSTGLKDVNDILYKFIYGSVVILTGKKGHGKSTLLNQLFVCDALEKGESIFIFSGEMGNNILKNWIETTLIGRENIELKDGFVRKFNKDAIKPMRDWYKGRILAFDDIKNDADIILDRAVNVTRRFGVKIWLLDNLMTLNIGVEKDSEQWLKQKEFIVRLVSLAKTYGVLIILVAHPKKQGNMDIDRRLAPEDVAGSNDLGNLAQYILSVHRFSKREKQGEKDGRGNFKKGKEPIDFDVVVDVLKNRYTGKVNDACFYFDYNSYRFFSTPAELWHRYPWNKDTSPLRKDDPNKHGTDVPDGFNG